MSASTGAGGSKLFVSGIPKQRSEAQVKEGLLRIFPNAEDVVVVMVSKGVNKGHAFVHFPSADDVLHVLASSASAEQPIVFDGAPLSLRQTVRKQPPLPAPSARQLQHIQAKATAKAAAAAAVAGKESSAKKGVEDDETANAGPQRTTDAACAAVVPLEGPPRTTSPQLEIATGAAAQEAMAGDDCPLPCHQEARTTASPQSSLGRQHQQGVSPPACVQPFASAAVHESSRQRCSDMTATSQPPKACHQDEGCSTKHVANAASAPIAATDATHETDATHDDNAAVAHISSISNATATRAPQPQAPTTASRMAYVPQPAALARYPTCFTAWLQHNHAALQRPHQQQQEAAAPVGTLRDVVQCLHQAQLLSEHQRVVDGVLDHGKWFVVLDETVDADPPSTTGGIPSATSGTLGSIRQRSASERLVQGFLARLRVLEPEVAPGGDAAGLASWKPLHGRCTMPRLAPLFAPGDIETQTTSLHTNTPSPVLASTAMAALQSLLLQRSATQPPPPQGATSPSLLMKRPREEDGDPSRTATTASARSGGGGAWAGAFKDRSGCIVLLRYPGLAGGVLPSSSV